MASLILYLFSIIMVILTRINGQSYKLVDTYSGNNFFDKFNFFTHSDYSHGYVEYMNESYCKQNGLINVTNTGQVYIGVDHTNKMIVGDPGRPSVRIESKISYNEGLFIADIKHMPQGCGVWPAWWFYGPYWPQNGEIDVIEQIDLITQNHFALHTNATCDYSNINETFDGKWEQNGLDCSKNECGQLNNNMASFGIPYNEGNGGYHAFQWLDDKNGGLYAWFWNRNDTNIPKSLLTNNPNPDEFGIPFGNYSFGDWCPYTHMNDNVMVIDIDLCGWASQEFNKYCSNLNAYNCVNYVAENPQSFVDSYWLINSIKVYQQS